MVVRPDLLLTYLRYEHRREFDTAGRGAGDAWVGTDILVPNPPNPDPCSPRPSPSPSPCPSPRPRPVCDVPIWGV